MSKDKPLMTSDAIIESHPEPLYSILTKYMDEKLLTSGFNGSVLIAKNDTVVYEKYFGKTDLRKKDSISAATSLQLASSGKMLTAVAALQLAENGKLNLEDSLGKFFPGFPYPGITVRMLLNHHSGLPNYLYFISDSVWDKSKRVTNENVLDLLYSVHPAAYFSPGVKFNYSNTNFVLLALIIEKVSGKKFPQYMKEQFFQPLGMEDTYVYTPGDSATATLSFYNNGQVWSNDQFDWTYGDKNIYSTPRDLFRWSRALFNGKIISPALMDSAFSPGQSGQHQKQALPLHSYGLGFRLLMPPGGKKVIYHFGRWHGFNAVFARLVDEKVTIIILGNRFNRNIYNVAWRSYNLFGNYFSEPGPDEDNTEQPRKSEKKKAKAVKKAGPLKKHKR